MLDLAADPAGLLAAAGNLDGSIVIWDAEAQPMQPITLTTGPPAIGVKNVAWAQHRDRLGVWRWEWASWPLAAWP